MYFWKILKYQISWKSVEWESSCFPTDGRTDITNIIVAFSKFANAPEKPSQQYLGLLNGCEHMSFTLM